MTDRLIVGLGNYGREHESTRHNIGWDVFDYLSFKDDLRWKDKFKGEYASIESDLGKVYFLKPMTYMNLSGESVLPLAQFFKVSIENILVVHDELDLPFGTIAFKQGGGLAGHNGLKSIAGKFGKNDFLRLRMGIGRPPYGNVSDWVLGRFGGDEAILIDEYLKKASRAVEKFVKDGFQKASGLYSRKKLVEVKICQ